MNYKDELQISRNFKKVKYDGRTYKVTRVVAFDPYEVDPKHKCVDGFEYTVYFDRYIQLGKKSFYVSFCNKCKTLFLKPA